MRIVGLVERLPGDILREVVLEMVQASERQLVQSLERPRSGTLHD